jgi:hypothetical protein
MRGNGRQEGGRRASGGRQWLRRHGAAVESRRHTEWRGAVVGRRQESSAPWRSRERRGGGVAGEEEGAWPREGGGGSTSEEDGHELRRASGGWRRTGVGPGFEVWVFKNFEG